MTTEILILVTKMGLVVVKDFDLIMKKTPLLLLPLAFVGCDAVIN